VDLIGATEQIGSLIAENAKVGSLIERNVAPVLQGQL